jgi:hypothetical protein
MPIKADQTALEATNGNGGGGGGISRNSSTLTTVPKKGYSKKRAQEVATAVAASAVQPIGPEDVPSLEEEVEELKLGSGSNAQPLQNPVVATKHNSQKIEGGEQQITVSFIT